MNSFIPETRFGIINKKENLFKILMLSIYIVFSLPCTAQEYNRGVGIYPGNPKEDFSPSMKIDNKNYRNLALYRAVYSSSNYDFNLTANLVTDGIKESNMPGWIVVSTNSEKSVPRNEREWILDRNNMTKKSLTGSNAWIQIQLAGGYVIPEVDSIDVAGQIFVDSSIVKTWQIFISGSNDGVNWVKLVSKSGNQLLGDSLTGWWKEFYPANQRNFTYGFKLDTQVKYHYYKLDFSSPNAHSWSVAEFGLFNKGKRTEIGGPYNFSSAWKSCDVKSEWIYVDLGSECTVNRIVLTWISKAFDGKIQISNDKKNWMDVGILNNDKLIDDVALLANEKCRFVRVSLTKPNNANGFILSEMEVWGTGGPVAVTHPSAAQQRDGKLILSGGDWKLQRKSLVNDNGEKISSAGFNDSNWIIATVPGTVLTSYLNIGAIPDPNFGDNQLLISDSFFYSDFWYRNQFIAPASYAEKKTFLNFDGINWKAEIFLNGKKLGGIEGAFTRAHFDVTNILLPGKQNTIAVQIIKNDSPGFVKEQTKLSHDVNGGELGTDNPTFHATVGWDWIPSMRGRDIGIWSDVYLSATGDVTVDDPFITGNLPLPDTTSADITVEVALNNHSRNDVIGKLIGRIGEIKFEQKISIGATEKKIVKLDPSIISSLRIKNPKLWWPNGYGKQNLYDVTISFTTDDGKISDSKTFKTGIREMSYNEDGGALKIFVNGKRFIAKGGNWGFSESMLRYRGREYDIAVRYHKEQNFTMIRNWVGQIGDDEFFEACDKYGIMIWQDFWLANPLDGPEPKDPGMFMNNVDDFVKRIRNHPSIGLYCGRNEGNPPKVIDDGIRKLLPQIHPDVHYISNSAFGVVSGGGPYRAMHPKFYFKQRATIKLHSELGSPAMVSLESLKKMLPDSLLWPINRVWGVHDFNLESAQYAQSFINMIKENFGETNDLNRWITFSQWINYQTYRAMFEAQSKNRMGLLLWMSHSAWPSMVWQTYDYYFEPTAAYFGCKKANEPLHIQWNSFTDSVEVVNYSAERGNGLTATIQFINFDGTVKSEKKFSLNCPIDNIVRCFKVEYPEGLSDVYFLRLKLERENNIISENFYWRSTKEKLNSNTDGKQTAFSFYGPSIMNDDFTALNNLPKVKVDIMTKTISKGNSLMLATTLSNNSSSVAPMVKLKVIGEKNKERILPVIFSDNYISLMPGEKKIIEIELQNSDLYGDKPVVVLEGINLN